MFIWYEAFFSHSIYSCEEYSVWVANNRQYILKNVLKEHITTIEVAGIA